MTASSELAPSEPREIAEEAYIYGFAVVENYKAIFGMCVYEQSPQFSAFNSCLHARKLFDPDYAAVATPNNDTLYSTTFADLRLDVPASQGGERCRRGCDRDPRLAFRQQGVPDGLPCGVLVRSAVQ